MSATKEEERLVTSSKTVTTVLIEDAVKIAALCGFGWKLFKQLTAPVMTAPVVSPNEFKFDANRKDSFLEAEFKVTEYRNYFFILQFEYQDVDDAKRVRDLVGDGAYKIYTQESVDAGEPELVYLKTIEDVEMYHQHISSGKYVSLPTDFSGAIPIHIRVSKKEADETGSLLLVDETVKTLGYFAQGFTSSGSGGRFDRMVIELPLKPSSYQIQVNTTQESPRFVDVKTKFAITFHSNALPFKEQNKKSQQVQIEESQYANTNN